MVFLAAHWFFGLATSECVITRTGRAGGVAPNRPGSDFFLEAFFLALRLGDMGRWPPPLPTDLPLGNNGSGSEAPSVKLTAGSIKAPAATCRLAGDQGNSFAGARTKAAINWSRLLHRRAGSADIWF